MKTILLSLVIIASFACGSANSDSTLAGEHSGTGVTFQDEYDANQSTRVTGWQIQKTFQFDQNPSGKEIAIKNVDAVREVMQIYIGSGTRNRYHVYVWSKYDLGERTDKITITDRLQPKNIKSSVARRMELDPSGSYVYRVSLPVSASCRSEIYGELNKDGRRSWTNQGRQNEFDVVSF